MNIDMLSFLEKGMIAIAGLVEGNFQLLVISKNKIIVIKTHE